MTRITLARGIELSPGSAVQVGDSWAVVANVYDDGVSFDAAAYSVLSKIWWTLFGRRRCIKCGHAVGRKKR